jgi:2-octaprenyl-6-methoxyphenol hydroxylase
MNATFDIIVIGGGLAGGTAALALARAGARVAAIAPPAPVPDGRTTALLRPSIDLLESLGVWRKVAGEAAPLRTMRIVDASRRLLRAPTVSFHAGEIGEDAFGENIANATLLAALADAMAGEPGVTVFKAAAAIFDLAADAAAVTLADGTRLEGRMVVAADGRNSLARQAAGIETRNWSYPQAALVLTFTHSLPHENISTEFHTEFGPFTQVPLPGNRSSLVWVVRPQDAENLMGLDRAALDEAVEQRMGSMLGKIGVDSPVQRFSLSGMTARRSGAGIVALVGEAAHVFPPIGAQGLNLGMRDVAELVRHRPDLTDRRSVEAFVARYDRARRADIRTRTLGVDLLNRSLLSGFLPVHLARAASLSLLDSLHPLRGIVVREGMMPGSALRSLASDIREKIGR